MLFGKEKTCDISSFFDIVDEDMSENQVNMSDFRGSILCVVNVASKWSLSRKNYTQLSQLVDDYGSRGLKVLIFPCNQFGGQEPGSNDSIRKFVGDKFNASEKFTWFNKGHVNGSNARDVFSFLKEKLPSEDGTNDIRWNFTKFLISHEGEPHTRYCIKTPPFAMKEAIEKLLNDKEEMDRGEDK